MREQGVSTGLLLNLFWISTRHLLDLYWISTRLLLNCYWTSTGLLLCLYWTSPSFGVSRALYKIHARWTSTGPLLNLLLDLYSVRGPQKMGTLMCLGRTASGVYTPPQYIYWIPTGPLLGLD